MDLAAEYAGLLDQLTVAGSGMKLVPELYMVRLSNQL